MNANFYIKIKGKQQYSSSPVYQGVVTVSKGKPNVGRDEIAIKFLMDIPDSLFIKPTLSAVISIPELPDSLDIIVEVADNIAEVIEAQTGIKVEISAPSQGHKDNE